MWLPLIAEIKKGYVITKVNNRDLLNIGALQAQKDCAAALGLKKVGDVKVHPENAATMGKVAKIAHLVAVTK